MDSLSTAKFQRVFTWRWQAAPNQEIFHLDYLELERVWQEEQAAHRAELDEDRDLEGDVAQLDVPYPGIGRVDAQGNPQRGGKIDRKPPQLDLLAACIPQDGTRLELETGFEQSTGEQLAQRMEWTFKHRGRPEGLSPIDYAAQRELTVARSLGWSFFEKCKDLPSVPVIWEAKFGAAAHVLGFLLWARTLGRAGVTCSAPCWASVLPGRSPGEPCAVSTVWRYLQLLERAGYLIRLRRYKPGIGGRPVALTANWYGLGPRALAELDGGAVARPTRTIEQQRARVRRRHLRAEGRRRGVDLLGGYAFPNLREFAGQVLDAWTAAKVRDDARAAAWRNGTPPVDWSGSAQRPSFVFDLAADELEVLDRLVVIGSEPAEPGQLPADVCPEVFAEPLCELLLEPLEPELERRPNDNGIAEVRRLLRGADEQQDRQIMPGITARAHGPGRGGHKRVVAPPRRSIPTPGRESFEGRRVIGAIGCVSLRDSRGQPPTIPISSGDAPPTGCEKSIRTGPQARDGAAQRARDNERDRCAQSRGPLTEPVYADTTAFSEVQDRHLAGLLAGLAKVRGFVVS